MMKKLLFICLLCFFCTPFAIAQFDCSKNALTVTLPEYREDAEQLAARFIYEAGLPDTAEIELPEALVTRILDALWTVYQNSDLPHWEEVIEQYAIHTAPLIPTRDFELVVDTSYRWAEELLGNTPLFELENAPFAELAVKYNFRSLDQPKWIPGPDPFTSFYVLSFSADRNINLPALLNELRQIGGIVEANALEADNIDLTRDISYQDFDSYIELTFRFSWKCVENTGCVNNHFWTYRITSDCTIEFIKEDGAALPIRTLSSFLSTGLYPNPTTDRVFAQILGPTGKDVRVILFNTLGKVLESRTVQSNTGLFQLDFSLKDQPTGMYFLGMVSDGKVLTERIIKR